MLIANLITIFWAPFSSRTRSQQTIVIRDYRSLPSHSHPRSLAPCKMPTEAINLANHTVILLSYENDYQQSRGADHQDILKSIMDEILAQYDQTPNERITKGLAKVSQLI